MEENYMQKRKNFDDLTIADDFMFCKVMENEDVCKTFLELVLSEKIGKINELSTQKTIITNSESKSVRLDILVTDMKKKIYNVEMQVVNRHNLAKRMRYYQSAIDVASLDKGAFYEDLNDTYIIFICMFDYIGKGHAIYEFENICIKDEVIYLQDGVKKLIINVDKYENTDNIELRSLLEYMKTGVSNNEFTRRLEKMINIEKNKITTRAEYNFVPGYIMDARYEERKLAKMESARILKQKNIDVEIIQEATGLSLSEIEKL